MKIESFISPKGIFRFAISGLLFVILYYSAFHWLINNDWAREDYNYAYLLPFLVLYIIWEKRDLLKSTPSTRSWWGIILFLPGILLFWFGELAGELFTLYISSWFVAVGLLWLHLGWRKLKILSFPFFTALFMFPPPVFLNKKLTFGLKLISSKIGVAMLQWYGMSAYREGNVIDMGFTQLQVVDACSGLRFFFPLIIMGILLAYFYRTGIWKGIILTISAIPLSMFMNSLRITLTGILYQYWGPKVAEDFFHGFSGWLIFMVSFAMLFGELWILRIVTRYKTILTSENAEAIPLQPKETAEAPGSGASPWFAFAKEPRFLASAAILVLTLVIFHTIDFREKPPLRRPFSQFPSVVGEWSGLRQYLDKEIITELDLTDYIIMDYRNASGAPVNFYVAYYQSQQKGESIHSPETCLPGGGWAFHEAGRLNLAISNGQAMIVNRAVMEKGDSRQLVYFWFPARGRILTNAYEMKISLFWDSLTRRRSDGSLVRIISPVLENEGLEKVESRINDFLRAIQPIMAEFIPD